MFWVHKDVCQFASFSVRRYVSGGKNWFKSWNKPGFLGGNYECFQRWEL